jgi:hypothetical protein
MGGGGRLFRLLGVEGLGLVGEVGLASSALGIGGGIAEKRGDVGDASVGGSGGDRMAGGGPRNSGPTEADIPGCSDSSSSDAEPALGDMSGISVRGGLPIV